MTRSTCLLLAITLYPALVFAQGQTCAGVPALVSPAGRERGRGAAGRQRTAGRDGLRRRRRGATPTERGHRLVGQPVGLRSVGAYRHLPEIRRLLFTGEHVQAQALVTRELLGDRPLGAYQPLGDLVLKFPSAGEVTQYHRELDLDRGVASVRFQQGGAVFTRRCLPGRG